MSSCKHKDQVREIMTLCEELGIRRGRCLVVPSTTLQIMVSPILDATISGMFLSNAFFNMYCQKYTQTMFINDI